MKHLVTYESYTYNFDENLNEGLIGDFFKKILLKFKTPEINKLKSNFEKDLPNLLSKFKDINKEDITKFADTLKDKLPNIIDKTIEKPVSEDVDGYKSAEEMIQKGKERMLKNQQQKDEYYRVNGHINTTGTEKDPNIPIVTLLDKIKDTLFMLFNMSAGASVFYLIWKVVFDWIVMHRALIPLEIGFWGQVSCVVILIAVLVNGIVSNFNIKGGGFLYPKN